MKKILSIFTVVLLIAAGIGIVGSCSSYSSPTTTHGIAQTSPPPGTTSGPDFTPGKTADVTIQNFAFSPATITVTVGTTVTWTNNDGATHTVTSDTGVFDSGNMANGKTYSRTFSQAGTFTYHCTIHPNMKATVIVQ
jgi:plastocyanin